MRQIAEGLRRRGHWIVSRWIDGQDTDDRQAVARDWEDLHNADCLVAFAETPGAPGRQRGGRHVEFGIALARGIRVILVGEPENVFHYLPRVEKTLNPVTLTNLLKPKPEGT
jgi:hypothetical protein